MSVIKYLKGKFDPDQTVVYDILTKNDLVSYDMITVSVTK